MMFWRHVEQNAGFVLLTASEDFNRCGILVFLARDKEADYSLYRFSFVKTPMRDALAIWNSKGARALPLTQVTTQVAQVRTYATVLGSLHFAVLTFQSAITICDLIHAVPSCSKVKKISFFFPPSVKCQLSLTSVIYKLFPRLKRRYRNTPDGHCSFYDRNQPVEMPIGILFSFTELTRAVGGNIKEGDLRLA